VHDKNDFDNIHLKAKLLIWDTVCYQQHSYAICISKWKTELYI